MGHVPNPLIISGLQVVIPIAEGNILQQQLNTLISGSCFCHSPSVPLTSGSSGVQIAVGASWLSLLFSHQTCTPVCWRSSLFFSATLCESLYHC